MTTVGQMASPQPEGDLREHTRVIHLTPTNSFRLTLFTSEAPKTGAASPTFRLGPTLLPPREFLFVPLPLFLSFLTPRRSIFFSTSSASLSERGLSRFQAPSKIHAQFVAVVSTLVGLPCFARCATSGATAAALESIPLQTTGGWLRGAAPQTPPWSHLQCPPWRQSPMA